MADEISATQSRYGIGLLDGRREVTEGLLFKLLHLMTTRGLLTYDDLQTMFADAPVGVPAAAQQADPYLDGLATGRDAQAKHLQEVLLPALLKQLPKEPVLKSNA